jgi:hypothetical protein
MGVKSIGPDLPRAPGFRFRNLGRFEPKLACALADSPAGGSGLTKDSIQPRVPPVPRIWGPGRTTNFNSAS